MAKTSKVVGGLGNATDKDVREGVEYTSENGIKNIGTLTLADMVPEVTNPATADEILEGYQGIGIDGNIIEGILKSGITQLVYGVVYEKNGATVSGLPFKPKFGAFIHATGSTKTASIGGVFVDASWTTDGVEYNQDMYRSSEPGAGTISVGENSIHYAQNTTTGTVKHMYIVGG